MKAGNERRNISYPVGLAGRQFDAAGAAQGGCPCANIEGGLTKESLMFIIHRITIQGYVGCNRGLVLSCSLSQFQLESGFLSGQLRVSGIPQQPF